MPKNKSSVLARFQPPSPPKPLVVVPALPAAHVGKPAASASASVAGLKTAKKTVSVRICPHRKSKKRSKIVSPIKMSKSLNKVLKQVHPSLSISTSALQILNDILITVCDRYLAEAVQLCEDITKKRTLTSREVQTAVRLVMPGELAKHAISEGTKAVVKCSASRGEAEGTKKKAAGCAGGDRARRAGLVFPVGRVHRYMKLQTKLRVGSGAPVYLSAVLEYIAAEVLELAGNSCCDLKRKRLVPRHIFLAVAGDEELDTLLQGKRGRYTVHDGGVIPHIHKSLIAPKQSAAKLAAKQQQAQVTKLPSSQPPTSALPSLSTK